MKIEFPKQWVINQRIPGKMYVIFVPDEFFNEMLDTLGQQDWVSGFEKYQDDGGISIFISQVYKASNDEIANALVTLCKYVTELDGQLV